MTDIQVCPNQQDLFEKSAAEFVRLARTAASANGRFTVALSGGSTPKGAYEILARSDLQRRIPWPRVHLFWGDERCVPSHHPESNYRMAEKSLISLVPIPLENVHRIATEREPNEAAAAYERTLRKVFNLSENELPRFDLILLGIGSDAHTASLFPGSAGLNEKKRLVIAHKVDKLEAWRITLTPAVLNQAARTVFLVSGTDKAQAVREVMKGTYEPKRLPAQLIRPAKGSLLWLLDQEAASLLHIRKKKN